MVHIATIAAYGSMMSISYYWEQILSHSYDLKKIGYLSLSILFSAVSFYGFRENYYGSQFINRVPIFYLSQ
jgi:dolichyl-phosphate-mannose--protein O-mannosyl transferase